MPKKLFLIDQWKTNDTISDSYIYHQKFLSGQLDKNHIEKVNKYYEGDITDQTTYDNLYNFVNARFAKRDEVQIIRKSSIEGFNELAKINDLSLDFCYIDANHEYQHVLDELLFFSDILSDHGLLQINDCCHSDLGVKQNLGVLEAANKFCKIANFVPVIAVNRNFTDVLLAPKNSQIIEDINFIVENNDIISVEVPNELFPNLSVKVGKRPQICFA